MLFGGSANRGAAAGLVYSNSNNVPTNTNSNVGSRQYFVKEIQPDDPATWRKTETMKSVSVGETRRLAEIKAEMKRFGNLYDRIISIENLDLAERKARKGKGYEPTCRNEELKTNNDKIQ